MTMGIIEYEQLRLRQQEIEVTALIALMNHKNVQVAFDATMRLQQIAYPEELIADLQQEVFVMEEPCFCGDDDCKGGCDDLL